MENTNTQAKPSQVPLLVRTGWGVGTIAEAFMLNAFLLLVMPIYNIGLGMDAVLLGWALFIPRFADAITDLWMGNISDNTRTRWGRRRPYIFIGSILTAISLPLLWLPPVKTNIAMFLYIMTMGLIYQLFYTMYTVPYLALGYELTTDYNERTRVLAWRMYFGQITCLINPWLYLICLKLQASSGMEVNLSAFWISIALGIIIIVTGVTPTLVCREKKQIQSQAKIHISQAIFYTLKNRPFLILLIGYIIILLGLYSVGTLGLYINIYYVCKTKEFAAKIQGIVGTMCALTSYLSVFWITWLSVRWGKRKAMLAGLMLTLGGVCGNWFTITPKMPYLQLISIFISALGLNGCYLLVISMVADICDEDELKTGLRREGIYSAVNGFASKGSIALTTVIGGFLLKLSGYDPKLAESSGSVPIEIALKMKMLLVGGQVITLILTIVMFYFYPITRARAEETRRILDERNLSKSTS